MKKLICLLGLFLTLAPCSKSMAISLDALSIGLPVVTIAGSVAVMAYSPACKAGKVLRQQFLKVIKSINDYKQQREAVKLAPISEVAVAPVVEHSVVVRVVPQEVVPLAGNTAVHTVSQEVAQPVVPTMQTDTSVSTGYNKAVMGGVAVLAVAGYYGYIHRQALYTKACESYKKAHGYVLSKLQALKNKFKK